MRFTTKFNALTNHFSELKICKIHNGSHTLKAAKFVASLCVPLVMAASVGAGTFAELAPQRVNEIAKLLAAQPSGIGPACSDRAAWGSEKVVKRISPLVAAADKLLNQNFPAWSDAAYLEFSATGVRTGGERMMHARKVWLYPLVLAECAIWNGKYIDTIEKTLTELNIQPTWTWPATDVTFKSFKFKKYEVDLLAADTAHDISQTLYMLGDRIRPDVRKQTLDTLENRIFEPIRISLTHGGKDNAWLRAGNNWNAVCLKGVVGAALAVLPKTQDRATFIAAGEHYIKNYLKGFPKDGYSLEGPMYWNYGFSHFAQLRQILLDSTGSKIDLFSDSKVQSIAKYSFNIEMSPGNIAPFGDAPKSTHVDELTRAYINQSFGFNAAFLIKNLPVVVGQTGNSSPIADTAMKLFIEPKTATSAAPSLAGSLHSYFEDVHVLVSRPSANQKLGVSFKAGGNGSHSHNDIGSYTISLGNEQPTGDPGVTLYSAKTFGKDRYKIKGINSYGHPVPLVAGQLQKNATSVQAAVLFSNFTDAFDEIKIDMSKVYPSNSIKILTRTLRHDRLGVGSVFIEDQYEFSEAMTFEVALIAENMQILKDGNVELWEKSERLQAKIEASDDYNITIEKIDEEGMKFNRLAIKTKTKSLKGIVRVLFIPK